MSDLVHRLREPAGDAEGALILNHGRGADENDLSGLLDARAPERGIGWERTVVGGFSMGAVMSYAVGLGTGRPSPRAILAFSGFIPTVEGWSADLDGRAGLPVVIHHGRNDPIISVEFARSARELLAGAGLDVEYLETDAGHWLPPEPVERAAALVSARESSKPR